MAEGLLVACLSIESLQSAVVGEEEDDEELDTEQFNLEVSVESDLPMVIELDQELSNGEEPHALLLLAFPWRQCKSGRSLVFLRST